MTKRRIACVAAAINAKVFYGAISVAFRSFIRLAGSTGGAACATIWNDYNAFMRDDDREPEARLHCHSIGLDMALRPLVRFDEPMRLEAGIGEETSERLHAFPEIITELSCRN